ncbi:MAG: tetratricopeptide repeat protein [Pirellulales bacterium]|nr:tetratricopeptide repeat protein [Pirellulales bacterium]
MLRAHSLTVAGLLVSSCLIGVTSPSAAAGFRSQSQGDVVGSSLPHQDQQRPPTWLDDRVRVRLDEALDDVETDRREAMTLYAIGRMKVNEGKQAEAARMFQRAHRLDPASLPILKQIVPVAFELERPGEAIRYALKTVDLDPEPNPLLMQFLGDALVQQGDSERALKLYSRVVELTPTKERKNADFLRMRLVMGELYHANHQFEQAAGSFRDVQAARQSPADFALTDTQMFSLLGKQLRTLDIMAESFLESGEFDEAERLFADVAAIAKSEASEQTLAWAKAEELLQQARLSAARGKHEQAIRQLDSYFAGFRADSPEADINPVALDLLESLLSETDRDDDFIGRLSKLRSDHPTSLSLVTKMAEVLKARNDDITASGHLEDFCDRLTGDGDRFRPRLMAALAMLVEIRADRGDAAEFFSAWSRLRDLTNNPELFARAADQAIAAKAEFASAVLAAAEASARTSDLRFGELLVAADIAAKMKQFDQAQEFFDLAIKQRPKFKADILLHWGMELLIAEEHGRAGQVFQRGIRERVLPFGQPDFYYLLAGVQTVEEDYEAALKSARRAAAMAADDPRILARLAWVQYQSGDLEAATAGYELIVRRFGDDRTPNIRDSVKQARLVLSGLAEDRENLPAAEEWLEQILDEFPDDEGAMNDLGYLWANQNKHLLRAYSMIRRAVDADPENATYLDSLGWVLHRLGKHQEAVKHLLRSLDLREQPSGTVLDHLGDAYLAAEDVDAARAAWQKAIQAFDPQREADKIQLVEEKLAGLPVGE